MDYALITGASYGIGSAFAHALAAQGRNLILTARSDDRLQQLAGELQRYGVGIQIFAVDLAAPDGVARLCEFVARRDLTVDLLINNAGFGSGGEFAKLELRDEVRMLDLNVRAVVALTHYFLRPMRDRRQGAILNVASTASFQPVPFMTTYAATKAFVLNFSLGLWRENRRYGVHVMALCPGTTATHFFEAAGIRPRRAVMQTAEDVVAAGLRGLRRRRPWVVSGWQNKLMVFMERVMPRTLVIHLAARFMETSI